MLVIGGYNSSNTANLARICAEYVPDLPHCRPRLPETAEEIRHRPVGKQARSDRVGLAAAAGPVAIGLTSGASTPDNLVGAAIAKLEAFSN